MKSIVRICCLSFCCFALGENGIYGASGAWTTTTGGGPVAWDATGPSNWLTTTGLNVDFPNGTSEVASFWSLPSSTPNIISHSNIRIGKLCLNTPGIAINFIGHTLTFSDPIGASIFVAQQQSTSAEIFGSINLESPLQVFVDTDSSFLISGEISGNADLILNGRLGELSSGLLELSVSGGNNTYLDTIVNGGDLYGFGSSSNIVIPHNLTINQGIVRLFDSDIISHGAIVTVYSNTSEDPGMFTIKGGTFQTCDFLRVFGGAVEPFSVGGASLSLLNPSQSIIIGENGKISLDILTLVNGGAIRYDNTQGGIGTFDTSALSSGSSIIIDLNSNNVTLDVSDTINISPFSLPFSFANLVFDGAHIQTGLLTKTGNGIVGFFNTLGVMSAIPHLTITDGAVLIGSTSSEVIQTSAFHALVHTVGQGTLQGFGQLGDSGIACEIQNDGIVMPGDLLNKGTLTISGNYTQSKTGKLIIKANISDNDKLIIEAGGVVLNGGTLFIQCEDDSGFVAGDSILVIDNTSGTGIEGKFNRVTGAIPPALNPVFTIEGNGKLGMVHFNPAILAFPCSSVPLSLKTYVNMSIPLFALANAHSLQLSDRLKSVRDRLGPYYYETNADNSELDQEGFLASNKLLAQSKNNNQIHVSRFRKNQSCEPVSIYVAPLGSTGDVDQVCRRESTQEGFDFNSVGVLAGSDYAFCRAGIGVQLAYESLDADVDDQWGSFDVKALWAKVYGTFLPFCDRDIFLDLSVSGGRNWFDIDRNVNNEIASGNPLGWQWDGYAGIGVDSYYNCWRFTPLASVQYIYLHIDDYEEHGADGFNARVAHQNVNSLRTWLGCSIGREFRTRCVTWQPEIRAYWQHEFEEQNRHVEVAPALLFNGTSSLQLFGGKDNFGTVGGELRVLFGQHWTLAFSYDYYWNNVISANMFYGEIGVNF